MDIEEIPLLGPVVRFGAQNRVFEGLLLTGPIVILLIAVVGRTPMTRALVVVYLLAFVGGISYAGLRQTDIESAPGNTRR